MLDRLLARVALVHVDADQVPNEVFRRVRDLVLDWQGLKRKYRISKLSNVSSKKVTPFYQGNSSYSSFKTHPVRALEFVIALQDLCE